MVQSRCRHSSDDEQHSGANGSFRERQRLGERLVSSICDLHAVPARLLEYHLPRQQPARSEPPLATLSYFPKEVGAN